MGSPPEKHGLRPGLIILISIADAVGVALIGLIAVYVYWKVKDQGNGCSCTGRSKLGGDGNNAICGCWRAGIGSDEGESDKGDGGGGGGEGELVAIDKGFSFELDELLRASAYVLGKSGLGIVYKVVLGNGIPVAVRRLGEGGAQRYKEFSAEAQAIGRVKHPNIVRLRAYYWAQDEKLLITDFISNGNLATALRAGFGGEHNQVIEVDNSSLSATRLTKKAFLDSQRYEDTEENKRSQEKRVWLRCDVYDTRIGIPEKALPTLFKKYMQASADHARKYGGTRLGLAICKQLTRWADMFPCVVARATATDVISTGMAGTRNGALQLMNAELQVLSPLVPIREVNFLRFCKQHAEGIWAVVDVSIDAISENSTPTSCRRLPSGCLVQDMPNGYSKVTWVEHAEYDDSAVHHLYRPLLRSGSALGSPRWLATLQRQSECLAILLSSSVPGRDHTAITASGRRSMLKLAQRMTGSFCTGVCASTAHKWSKLCAPGIGEDVRVMTRQSVDDPGEPPGVVLSAATSVWLPVSPQRVFDFLRDERLRSEWDILSNGGPMQEMAHIAKGQDHGNAVSLLRASAGNANQSSMLILQETCTDASGALVVYAPVDIPAMHVVMNGGDSAYVALLPSGFAIVPDGQGNVSNAATVSGSPRIVDGGSLLTVAFQILVNSLPTAKLTVESVETVNNLISCTVQKIKAALQCES